MITLVTVSFAVFFSIATLFVALMAGLITAGHLGNDEAEFNSLEMIKLGFKVKPSIKVGGIIYTVITLFSGRSEFLIAACLITWFMSSLLILAEMSQDKKKKKKITESPFKWM
jgi:type III secretory pathway component EscV